MVKDPDLFDLIKRATLRNDEINQAKRSKGLKVTV